MAQVVVLLYPFDNLKIYNYYISRLIITMSLAYLYQAIYTLSIHKFSGKVTMYCLYLYYDLNIYLIDTIVLTRSALVLT